MTLTTYVVEFYPFPNSDSLSAKYWTGLNEDDCRQSWEKANPQWPIKSIEEKP